MEIFELKISHRDFIIQPKSLFENKLCLAGVAQWIEHWAMKKRATSSIPSQTGHMLGLQAKSPVGGVGGATTH